MYLDFIDDKVVHPYFVLFQVMGVNPSLKMYPLVDFFVFMSPLQSTSLNLISCFFFFPII
jgi:hypothetical protein